jgi:hypothetical protein
MCGSGVRWCDMHGKGIAISITYLKGDGPMRLIYIYFGHLRHWNPDDFAKALKERDRLPVLSRQNRK